MKTMKMETKNDTNRVGIYTQVSAEATAAGEGLAPQGEKSPVVTRNSNPSNSNNRNQAEYMEIQANQSQWQSHENTIEDEGNPFRKEANSQASSSYSGECDGGDERVNRDHKYRLNRIVNMRKEFKKLNFSNSAIVAMEEALENERKKRHNDNKMTRYCQENNLDLQTAKQQMLERKEREIAKYKAEKAAREANKVKNRGLGDLRADRRERFRQENRNRNDRLNQASGRKQGEPKLVFKSPAILAGAKASLKEQREYEAMQPGTSRSALLNLNQRFGDERSRSRSRSPVNHFSTDGNRPGGSNARDAYLSTDSAEMDSTEKSVSAFCNSYSFAKLSKKQQKKVAAGTYVPKPIDIKHPIEIQIVNRANPFGGVSEDDQQLLLNGLRNVLREERDNGSDWIRVGKCEFKKKILHVHCGNDDTISLLEQKIPFFNRLLPEADLYLSRNKVFFSYKKVRVTLNNYNLTTEEFFKIIKKQNDYPTESWQEFWRKDDDQNMSILFGVDEKSFERLQKNNGFVYFFFGKLLLSFDKFRKKKN